MKTPGIFALSCGFFSLFFLIISPIAGPIAQTEQPSLPESLIGYDAHPLIEWEYDQVNPAVAFSPDSSLFLVVWEDHHWGFGDDWDIYGRMVDLQGNPVGNPFGIAWVNSNHRLHPSVAYNSNTHEFLVVYEYTFGATDHDILGRRVSSTGSLIGDELTITSLISNETHPTVVFNPEDNDRQFLVVWQTWVGDIDFGNNDLYGKLLDAGGIPLTSPIAIRVSSDNESAPAAAYFPSTDQYLVMWSDMVGLYPRLKKQWISHTGTLGDYQQYFTAGANYNVRLASNPLFFEYVYVFEDKYYGPPDIISGYVYLENITGGAGGPVYWEHPGDSVNIDMAHNLAADDYFIVWEEITNNQLNHAIYRLIYDMITPHSCCQRVGPDLISSTGITPRVASGDGMIGLIVWSDYRNTATNGLDVYAMAVYSGWVFLPIILN